MTPDKSQATSPRARRIHWIGPALECSILLGLLVLFNAFPDKIGVVVSATDPGSFFPLLSPSFRAQIPWLSIWWGLSLVLAMAKLALGRWTVAMRWADLALSVCGALILVRLLLGGPILWSGRLDGWVVPVIDFAAKGVLAVVLIGLVFGATGRLMRLVDQRRVRQAT